MINLIDLFCCAGCATIGYERAGLKVIGGVDVVHQPNYPREFLKQDALTFLRHWIDGRHTVKADLVHASPPCRYDAAISKGTNAHLRESYDNLYPPTKALLEELYAVRGIPYVIENPRARPDVVLCGEMFGLKVQRHRRFELGGWTATRPTHIPHRGLTLGMRHGKLVTEENGGYYWAVYGQGGYKGTVPQWQEAMGITHTDVRREIAEAIPPAYSKYIGQEFIEWRQGRR